MSEYTFSPGQVYENETHKIEIHTVDHPEIGLVRYTEYKRLPDGIKWAQWVVVGTDTTLQELLTTRVQELGLERQ